MSIPARTCHSWRLERMYYHASVTSNGPYKFFNRPTVFLLLMLFLLSACNESGGDQASGEKKSGEVWSLDKNKKTNETESGDQKASVQADKGVENVVPATELAPGAATVEITTENPFSGVPEAITAGERHFLAFNCAGCHAPKGGGGMGPPLSDDQWIYGDKPAQIYNSIVQGRPNGMPSFGAMLPEKVVWQLVAYIETLNNQKFKQQSSTNTGDSKPSDEEDEQQTNKRTDDNNTGNGQRTDLIGQQSSAGLVFIDNRPAGG